MIRVLGVLGFRLAVTARGQVYGTPVADASTPRRDVLEKAYSGAEVARKLTEALNSSEVRPVIRVFAEVLRKQDNIARLSKETIRCRETFYRAFVHPHVPRFSTALTLLDALGFSFSIRRVPPYKLSTRSPRSQVATAIGSKTRSKSRPLSIAR